MKRIINGKKYDTETAELLGQFKGNGDLGIFTEQLYIKRTGEYFLACTGEKYQYSFEYGYTDLPVIFPLTEDEAKLWFEQYFSADAYEKIFGEVEE